MDDTQLASVASAARRQDYPRHLANALIVELAESARGERVRASQLADALRNDALGVLARSKTATTPLQRQNAVMRIRSVLVAGVVSSTQPERPHELNETPGCPRHGTRLRFDGSCEVCHPAQPEATE